MPTTMPSRRVITFYSYKGGVGRTMALANVAFRLANTHALRVLAVDWDLEAPGLHAFFGLDSEEMSKARGVLDFLFDWRDAIKTGASAPPDVRSWFLPVTKQPYAPHHGSLAILPAGKMDGDYDARLGRFSWRSFYKRYQGGVAVETLREQLIESADIVLIDSRTGLTDAGGICTIQLPDGVVLMSAPNGQSLLGIERVARGILSASDSSRAERGAPTLWFSLSRISVVEETIGASNWIREHEPWFEAGVGDGLWAKENHLSGITSHVIPFRAIWSFGEQVLTKTDDLSDGDLLGEAFDRIATTLLEWSSGTKTPPDMREPLLGWTILESADEAKQEVALAEKRGDIPQLRRALHRLGHVYKRLEEYDEAIAVLERCAGIDLARGDRIAYGQDLASIGSVLTIKKNFDEAQNRFRQALDIFREQRELRAEVATLRELGYIYNVRGLFDEALTFYDQALALARAASDLFTQGVIHEDLASTYFYKENTDKARRHANYAVAIYSKLGERESQLRALLKAGNFCLEQGELVSALDYYKQSLTVAGDIRDGRLEGIVHERLGSTYKKMNQIEVAREHYKKSIELFRDVKDLEREILVEVRLERLLE